MNDEALIFGEKEGGIGEGKTQLVDAVSKNDGLLAEDDHVVSLALQLRTFHRR